jgi:hypothetical protein
VRESEGDKEGMREGKVSWVYTQLCSQVDVGNTCMCVYIYLGNICMCVYTYI